MSHTITLRHGDCFVVLGDLEDGSIGAVVADPPYGLEFMNKDWDAPWKTGAGMCEPGIGDRPIPWPSFGGQAFGGANPTCATCGGRARGTHRCTCEEPDWRVDGEPLEDSGVVTSPEQKRLFQAWCVSWLKECLRVLQPGGMIKIFGATRMYHRMCAAMEEAGFLLDPAHSLEAWGYGCLTEDTEVLAKDGWVHYHSAKVGTHILGFDLQTGQFDWQPVKETFEYPYDQGAFRLIGDGTDHIVSVQHRCVVQRDGGWVFVRAEELAGAEVVPCVWWSVHTEEGPAGDVRAVLCQQGAGTNEEALGGAEGPVPPLHCLRDSQVVSRGVDQEGHRAAGVLPQVQRSASGPGVGEARPQGRCGGDSCWSGLGHSEDDGSEQPCLEGRGDILQEAWELLPARADQVRPVSFGVQADGPQGRVRHGASVAGGPGTGSVPVTDRDGSSPEPQPDRQPAGEPGAVRLEPGSQAVRGAWDAAPSLAGVTVRVEPTHYTGIVWCVRVPTGAFIARRNGMAFVTGNSGFPKYLNTSKAIDQHLGKSDERKVVGVREDFAARANKLPHSDNCTNQGFVTPESVGVLTEAATEDAARFDGWATALKPGWEPFAVGTKPL